MSGPRSIYCRPPCECRAPVQLPHALQAQDLPNAGADAESADTMMEMAFKQASEGARLSNHHRPAPHDIYYPQSV